MWLLIGIKPIPVDETCIFTYQFRRTRSSSWMVRRKTGNIFFFHYCFPFFLSFICFLCRKKEVMIYADLPHVLSCFLSLKMVHLNCLVNIHMWSACVSFSFSNFWIFILYFFNVCFGGNVSDGLIIRLMNCGGLKQEKRLRHQVSCWLLTYLSTCINPYLNLLSV